MLKLSPWMYFVLMILSFMFLSLLIIIDALVFGITPVSSIAAFIPVALAFLAQIKRKED